MNTQYYTVVAGDSLWGISRKFNTTVDALVKMNKFASANVIIHPGQRIIVKIGTTGQTPPPTPTPNNNKLEMLVQWFLNNQNIYKYSEALRHQEGYADCSSAVYRALIYAGILKTGTYLGNTASLFQLEGTVLMPIQRHEARFGDIFVSGYKPTGSHTGVFVNNKEIVHMINETYNIKQTALEGWIGGGNVYCYRIKGSGTSTVTPPTPPTPPKPPVTPNPNPTTGEKVEKSYSESGKFTANRSVAIRNEPKATAASVATLLNGESVTYDSVTVTNKFIYISYISFSGTRRYVAVRTNTNGQRGPLWGTII